MGKIIISTSCKNLQHSGIIKSTIKEYLKAYSKAFLHRLISNARNRDFINEINNNKENVMEIVFRLPYTGSKGEQLVKHCLKKMKRCLRINVKFVVIYDTTKISFYRNVKD